MMKMVTKKDAILLYLSPVKNIFSLKTLIQSMQIYDTAGRLMKVASNTSTVDVSNLSSGQYVVKGIAIDGEIFVKRIVKE